MKKRLLVGLTGASGAPLAVDVLRCLRDAPDWETHLICSDGFRLSLASESDLPVSAVLELADAVYDVHDLAAAPARGTFRAEGMLVVPCSMKTAAGIASGYSDNLLLRAADVTVKEGRKLVLAVRECPLSPIHLKNLLFLSEIGVRILPPVIPYYAGARTVEELTRQIAGRCLAEFGIDCPGFVRWKS